MLEATPVSSEFFPVSDPRHKMLLKVFEHTPKLTGNETKEVLVSLAIQAVKQCNFTEEEMINLKLQAFKGSTRIASVYADKLAEVVKQVGTENLKIISIGSGAKGSMEAFIDKLVKTKLEKDAILNWIGTDTYKPDDFGNSFFKEENFQVLPEGVSEQSFRDILGIKEGEKVIFIANYVYHHMGIDFEEFKKMVYGAEKVFILEEPIEDEKEKDINYLYSQIAYDVLANVAINPLWANIFLNDPSSFKVGYLKASEIVDMQKQSFAKTYPEVVLVSF